MKGSMLSCCTTVPSCNRQGGFHLAASLPSALAMGRDGPTGSAPIATFGVRCIRQRSSGSEGPPQQLVESIVERHLWRPGKSFGGSIQINKKMPNPNPDFRILTYHVLPCFFMTLFGIWLVSNWFVHGRKLSPRPCLKSCVSWNLRAKERAMDS